MRRVTKISFIVLIFSMICVLASADRGSFGRKRAKIHLNITPFGSLKRSIPFNLKTGLVYRSSALLDRQFIGASAFNSAFVSFKKGNSIYILPFKQKVIISTYSPSEGFKLVIRSK